MAILTNYYVDPSGGNDTTGDGSIGTPWKTVQKALNTITRDATNGDQINVKAGGTDTLSATLSFTSYGTPTSGAPVVIRGYTTTANDSGVGVIDGNGFGVIFELSKEYIHLIDLVVSNSGGNSIVRTAGPMYFRNVAFSDSSNSNGLYLLDGCVISGCSFQDLKVVRVGEGSIVCDSYFKNGGTRDFTDCVLIAGDNVVVDRCVFSVSGSSSAIDLNGSRSGCQITNNSILAVAGNGTAIDLGSADAVVCRNNIIEGFSGTFGRGFVHDTSTSRRGVDFRSNAVYNCTTAFVNESSKLYIDQDHTDSDHDNETLLSSPFAKSGSDTFANRMTYFALNDVGNVREGGYVG